MLLVKACQPLLVSYPMMLYPLEATERGKGFSLSNNTPPPPPPPPPRPTPLPPLMLLKVIKDLACLHPPPPPPPRPTPLPPWRLLKGVKIVALQPLLLLLLKGGGDCRGLRFCLVLDIQGGLRKALRFQLVNPFFYPLMP